MKKIVCNVLSLIFFICTIISLIVVVTVRGVGFIDLSSVARMIFGVTALFFVSMSLLLWQTEYKKEKRSSLLPGSALYASYPLAFLVITFINHWW